MSEQIKILIADDEAEIRRIVGIPLIAKGYAVLEAGDGQAAVDLVKKHADIDLIILDIMMPVRSGVEAARELRRFSTAPILFLTAFSGGDWMEQAYMSGGDDFLAKPFSQSELLLKVDSLLRRYRVYKGKTPLGEDIALETSSRRLCCGGNSVELTDTEYSIAECLLKNRGQVLPIDVIYERVWGEKYLSADANTVMVHIMKLRKKTASLRERPIIRTVWGKGYVID